MNNTLVIGRAKTGTTVISKAIQHSIENCVYHLEPRHASFFENAKQLDGVHVVKILFEHWSDRPNLRMAIIHNEMSMQFQKKVAIIRDPRDTLISTLYYRPLILVNKRGATQDQINEWVGVLEAKEAAPSTIGFLGLAKAFEKIFNNAFNVDPNQFNGYLKFIARNKDELFVIKYEDFMRNNVLGLENYLGIKLTSNREVDDLGKTKRTADFDNWKSFFTDEDVKALLPIYSPIIGPHGYEDWDLESHPKLDPMVGSKYVRKLISENSVKDKPNKIKKS
jgi:hypothetical protein